MDKLTYRLPDYSDEVALSAYVQEHYTNGESSISASMGLPAAVYAQWVQRMHGNASAGDEDWGRSLLYLCFDQARLVGLLSIRWELSPALAAIYGHIGYGVRPGERRKGYATAMLRHALEVCRMKGLSEVILGCYKDNTASVRTILKCGGVLTAENDNYSEGRISQYYKICL